MLDAYGALQTKAGILGRWQDFECGAQIYNHATLRTEDNRSDIDMNCLAA